MRRYIVAVCVSCFLFVCGVSPALAEERRGSHSARLEGLFMDTLYGAAIGALVGAAVSAPQNDADWGGNIGAGIAIGAVAGLVYGVAMEGHDMMAQRAVIEIQPDKVAMAWPDMMAKVDMDRSQKTVYDRIYLMNLLQYRF